MSIREGYVIIRAGWNNTALPLPLAQSLIELQLDNMTSLTRTVYTHPFTVGPAEGFSDGKSCCCCNACYKLQYDRLLLQRDLCEFMQSWRLRHPGTLNRQEEEVLRLRRCIGYPRCTPKPVQSDTFHEELLQESTFLRACWFTEGHNVPEEDCFSARRTVNCDIHYSEYIKPQSASVKELITFFNNLSVSCK